MNFFAQRNGGELASRAALGDRLSGLMSGSLLIAVVNLLAITVYGAVMLGYDLLLASMVLGFAVLNMSLLMVMTQHMEDSQRRMLQEDGRLQALLYQGFASIESFRANGTENVFFRRWAGAHAKVITAEQAMVRWRRLLSNLVMALATVAGIGVVLVGGLRVMEGVVTIGMLVAFQSLMSSFNAPVASFVGLSAQLQDARGYIDRLDDVLRQKTDPLFTEERAVVPLPHLRGRLAVEHLEFSHSGVAQPLFRNVNLNVPPGQRVALIGRSGSGKSTLGRLMVGLSLPQQGGVLIDGAPIDRLDNHVLRSALAYVDQSITLFPGTIRDNITMWDPSSTEERMVQAAKDATLHEIIAARPNAYDSIVDDDGRNFSGGERQRLAIARALATDPAVLILDEATSALDAMAEKAILDNIRRRGCTCVLISHRLSAVRDCDEIVVLDHGAVIEQGRHTELMERAGIYRRLVEA
jgi:ABC-type bacteriocin/lantibiotic exporter with double-glycine peptidase domain